MKPTRAILIVASGVLLASIIWSAGNWALGELGEARKRAEAERSLAEAHKHMREFDARLEEKSRLGEEWQKALRDLRQRNDNRFSLEAFRAQSWYEERVQKVGEEKARTEATDAVLAEFGRLVDRDAERTRHGLGIEDHDYNWEHDLRAFLKYDAAK